MVPPRSQELSVAAEGLGTDRQASRFPPDTSGRWKPLLDGNLAERAWEAVDAIGRHLSESSASDRLGAVDGAMFTGSAGVALCLGYLARWQGANEEAAAREFARAVSVAAETPQTPTLCGGLAGLGWAASHLRALVPGLDAGEINDEIDAALLESLGESPWAEDYELLYGLVGIGVYALERLPRPPAIACLEQVIDRLEGLAERQAEEITWRVNLEMLVPETRADYPHGCYDLGLAHGVPGVIAFLGRACEAGVAGAKARRLLEGAGRWLVGREPGDGRGFSRYLDAGDGRPDEHRRLAWCSGDLSVAAALLVAGRCAGLPAWEREGLAVARRAAQRPPEQSGVRDAGLCHGAAGVAHLFNRMYQVTGDRALGEADRFWFGRALDMRQPGQGVGGYQAFRPERPGDETWVDDAGVPHGRGRHCPRPPGCGHPSRARLGSCVAGFNHRHWALCPSGASTGRSMMPGSGNMQPRMVLPRFTDRLSLGDQGLRVSPFCLGMVRSADTVCVAFDAGINFFFLSADMHWPLYEASRRGLELLLSRGPGVRDQIVVAVASYATQPEFCHMPFEEVLEAVPGLDRIDVPIAGGAYANEFLTRLAVYREHRRTGYVGARAIGTSFHDRRAALLACNHNLVDLVLMRYNPEHAGAREDMFPYLASRGSTRLFNFKSTRGFVAPDRMAEFGLHAEAYWQPDITDYYRFALSRPEIDGLLVSPATPPEVEALVEALEKGPLDDEEQAYLLDLAAVASGRAKVAGGTDKPSTTGTD